MLAALIGAGLAGSGQHVAFAEGIEVRSSVSSNSFPQGGRFTLFAASDANITNVRFRYRVLPDGPVSFARAQCSSGREVSCTAVVGDTRASYIVPGAELTYAWEIEDANGQKADSPEGQFTYRDSRFQWDSITEGNVTVNFYFGDDATNQSVMRAARETIDRFTRLEGTTIDFPVKVWVYQTAREMQPALGGMPGGAGQILGEVGAPDTALVSRDQDFLNVVRHELAHIVTRRATRGFPTEVPSWINEGLSTFAQSRLLPNEEQVLSQAIRTNKTLPVSSLSSSIRGNDFSLAYAQSGVMISFLVQTYGEEKFAQFIAGHRADSTDGAMQKVYGFNQLGLENEWRRSVGLPPVTESASQNPNQSVIPTIAPLGAGGSQSSSPATPASGSQSGGDAAPSAPETAGDDSGGGSSVVLIAGVLAAILVAVGGAFYFVRRPRGPSSAA